MITTDHARRFLVRRHLLDPPRGLPGEPESVLRVVETLGSLQFDPLEVPGARNHELVLHARINGFDRAHADKWLYGAIGDRRLVELYNKSLNIVPAHELPFYRAAWERAHHRHRLGILKERKKVAAAILARLRAEGPLATGAFANHDDQVAWHWAPTREGRAVLEALFETGAIGIARRDGSRRTFDVIDRLLPKELLATRVSAEESLRHRLVSRHRGFGLMGQSSSPELVVGLAPAKERARVVADLVAEKILVPVEIEGFARPRYILGEELPILEKTARASKNTVPEVSFLAPLDPFMWDRRTIRALFDFDYIWEVYTPEAKRKFGYYVLPILYGDRLVGRIEPRLDRATRTLTVRGIWFEHGFDPMATTEFSAALGRALRAYAAMIGASRVTWSRGRVARALARVVNA